MANPNRLTAKECIALIKEVSGRDIKLTTWHSYAHRGQVPAAVDKVGSSPVWDRAQILDYAQNPPGHGARTDLRPPRTLKTTTPAKLKQDPNLITAQQCLDLIKETSGRDIKLMTWHSYVHRGHAPAAVEKIGNTLLWKRSEIVHWIENRPGHGARTDLRPTRTRRAKKTDTE